MSWLKALMGLFSALPRLLDFLEGIAADIRAWFAERAEQKRRDDLARALKQAEEENKACELQKVFNPNTKCPPDSK